MADVVQFVDDLPESASRLLDDDEQCVRMVPDWDGKKKPMTMMAAQGVYKFFMGAENAAWRNTTSLTRWQAS